MYSEDAKMVAGVSLRERGVSMELTMDPESGGMWSSMNRRDGAYEKVIHGRAILSAALLQNCAIGHPNSSLDQVGVGMGC